MTRKVVSVAGDRSVREAAQTMISRGVHRVLVTTTGRRLLGIVTTLDLVRAIADGRIGE
jgi:CBS domain-containing protein